MLASSVCSLSCTCPALVPYLSSSCCVLVAYARFGCTFHSSVAWMCKNRLRRSHFSPNSRFRKKRSRYTAVVRVFLSRVRARVLYIWCLGGNECLACSALHPSCFLPYFSLIGFKVGGVNAEKGVSCGVHKAKLLTYAMGEWGICSARLVVW